MSVVRIVVVGFLADLSRAHTGARPGRTAEPSLEDFNPNGIVSNAASHSACAVLECIGDDAKVEEAADVAACLARLHTADIDLVVLDAPPIVAACELLDAIGDAGPPVVVVVRQQSDETALEAFRHGAADCIRVGADFAEVLPAVALEQIRRWRNERERSAVQQKIRWLEKLNDAIVSEIPAALAVIGADGRIVTINPACCALLRVDAGKAEGELLEAAFHADLVESGGLSRLHAESVRELEASPRLAQFVDANGEVQIYDVRGRRLEDQGRTLVVLSDVTEVELQARRIDELRRYNENIIQNMNSALVVIDSDRQVSFANPTAERILGVEPGALPGRCIDDWFDVERPEAHLLARSVVDGVRFQGAETVISQVDGSVVPIGISCGPLHDEDGGLLGAVAIFQDLSDIKQLERQVLQSEKMASIGQLAAGVAHEINNPMGFIHANLFQMSEYLVDLRSVWKALDSLQTSIEAGKDVGDIRHASQQLSTAAGEIDLAFIREDFEKAVLESQEGSERIRHIVRDLRDFSHQDTESPMLTDVNQCVDSTANIAWTMMKHSIRLEKDYADLPRVRSFPMQLKQVFMNLIVNAYQAIESDSDGTGDIGKIEIRTAKTDSEIVVSIRDSGIGIPAEHLDRIFDPFFTTKEIGAGTGLGLSTSYNIVKRHGGEIRVVSEKGEGTLFEVRLPLDGIQEIGG